MLALLFHPGLVKTVLWELLLRDGLLCNTGRNTLRELAISQLKDADTPEKHQNCVISF